MNSRAGPGCLRYASRLGSVRLLFVLALAACSSTGHVDTRGTDADVTVSATQAFAPIMASSPGHPRPFTGWALPGPFSRRVYRYGSAVYVGPRLLLTAAHLWSGPGTQFHARGERLVMLRIDETADLMLLWSERDGGAVARVGSPPGPAERVMIVGNPLNIAPAGIAVFGRVSANRGDGYILVDARILPGMSGAAVYSLGRQRGRLVGIAVRGIDDGVERLMVAVGTDEIRAFLEGAETGR